jgi:hypothetical protein
LIVALVELTSPTSSIAQSAVVELEEVGTYTLGPPDRPVSGAVFHQITTTIPVRLGVCFGFCFRIEGGPDGRPVTLRQVRKFPHPGIGGQTRNESVLNAKFGARAIMGWCLDKNEELVPGMWIFEVWQGQRLLTSQAFSVVRQ